LPGAVLAQVQIHDDDIGAALGHRGDRLGGASGQAHHGDVAVALQHLQ